MATLSMHADVPPHVSQDRVFDYDLFHDRRLEKDVRLGMMSLFDDAPDIFWTPRNGGHWMATRFADVQRIVTSPKLFSSVDATIRSMASGGKIPLPPQDMDAPDHMRHRVQLLKFLSPKDLKKQEPNVVRLMNELIDQLDGRHACDFKQEIAVPLPVVTFMTIMQWDVSRLREFVGWVHDIIGTNDPAKRFPAFMALSGYLRGVIDEKMATPGDDPISVLLASEIGGVPLTPERVQEMANLLFTAGLDTVTNAMTFMMKHLAENPEMQRDLRAHPDRIEGAVEELLRRYSFVNTSRRIAEDTEFDGVELRKDEIIVCSLSTASNDDRSVACPENVDLDRGSCPHLAFNTGPHNCVGAPLVRLELRVFLAEWLRRMPDVRLAPDFVPETRGSPVMTLERLPIEW